VARVLVSGICGRMGSLAAEAIAASGDLVLVAGVESPGHEMAGKALRLLHGAAGFEVPVRGAISEFAAGSFDVVVDFSTPAQAAACAEAVRASGKGLVVGTTGLSAAEDAAVRAASATCPVVIAPNASIGANVLFGIVADLARALGDAFDVEIVETHHRAKRDAPSGTAGTLADIVCRVRGLDPALAVTRGRSGSQAARKKTEVGVHSVRGGSVVGQHAVRFISDVEEIAVSHEAFSRAAFASGAAAAARFVADRAPGLYDMLDVLGLRRPRQGPGAP
jgi:4-hydroxy-tetrahydrodipicolinate reductase